MDVQVYIYTYEHTCNNIFSILHWIWFMYLARSVSFFPQNSDITFNNIIGLPSSLVGGVPACLGRPNPLSSIQIQCINCCNISSAAI